MSFHVIAPFNPAFPVTTNMGIMEVPIIDVDIDPDPGHVNPFRTGADRRAQKRHYHVGFDLTWGNAYDLNPVMQNPYFRSPGNRRVGGPFGSSGPWGDGVFVHSQIWLRYYAPDLSPDGSVDPLAGVPIPKALLRLQTGETFWMQPNMSLAVERQLTTAPGKATRPYDPPAFMNSSFGWFKFFSILLVHAESRAIQQTQPYGPLPPAVSKRQIRNTQACFFNMGPNQQPPGNIGHSATDHPYNQYLVRPFVLGHNKVYAITGRMPTTPSTRKGEAVMTKAQARYWSICHTGNRQEGPLSYHSLGYGCLMDDEILTDEQNEYLIVYSRGSERPWNAKAECGVTWQDFGPQSHQSAVIRWMSVYPDHWMDSYAPTDETIPWKYGSWSEDEYDESLVGKNEPGILGPYHPVIHYLNTEDFEALGCPVDARQIPKWR